MKSSCLCVASTNVTPFIISVQDALVLGHSEGFHILRKHLKQTLSSHVCKKHDCSPEDLGAWLVIRDILHALLAPIVALQEHAVRVAGESLQSDRIDTLEYAFYGNARGAFVWLQSFLSSEMAWCLSAGCPACVVSQAMDSESALRLLIASCFLSGVESDTDMGRPTLPSFEFFIRSINEAMDDDDLWGPSFFEHVEGKAVKLQNAMQDLMYQCQTIEMNLTPPESPSSVVSMSLCEPSVHGMPIKRSDFARKQAHMLKEEAQWLRSVVKHCWSDVDNSAYASPITTEFVRRLSAVES